MTEQAKILVKQFVLTRRLFDPETAPDFKVLVVWQCKTLQNWKWLLITDLPDLYYFEVTFDGDQDKFYLDWYEKKDNVVIDRILLPKSPENTK